jgi:hypothetical protein
MHPRWVQWLLAIVNAIQVTISNVGSVALTTQAASVATVAVPTPTLAGGLYRLSYSARITRAATTSSSLTVGLAWTDGGVSCSQAFAAMTGNTTATVQSGSAVVSIDATTTARYQTTYASVGATAMQYRLTVLVEAL